MGLRVSGSPRLESLGVYGCTGLDGNFHELRERTAVTVAHDGRPAGELDREVRYRLEHSNTSSETATLPVRYEIAVKPVI
jgi:hypothetical protein